MSNTTDVLVEEVQETGIAVLNTAQYVLNYVSQKPLYLIAGILFFVVQQNDIKLKVGKLFNMSL